MELRRYVPYEFLGSLKYSSLMVYVAPIFIASCCMDIDTISETYSDYNINHIISEKSCPIHIIYIQVIPYAQHVWKLLTNTNPPTILKHDLQSMVYLIVGKK